MNRIGRFFANPIAVSLVGLLVIALLVWFAGPHIKFGADNYAPLADAMVRAMVIMAILFLWLALSWAKQLHTSRNNKLLVDDIHKTNKNAQYDMASEQAADEVALLNERFTSALNTLNKLKFNGKGRKKALYQLPWYIIVGPPGSGKTTALVNSGLEFPLADEFGKGALQGVGGTRNCDWWFTNEAVLIDTAGRYTTQDSHKVIDGSAWAGFLDLLKRNRRRRPINGAIVAISLQDLLLQSEEERALHAKTIRNRLDELMEKLEIRFPVYLMFTKTDLVSGFGEFFASFGKDEREQVWGVSLPDAPKPNQSPDFGFLHQELGQLVHRLNERVIWRMHQERDAQRCAEVEGFPLQMSNVMQLAESFVARSFAQNRFQVQPYLRGVYFSSGTQDGTPIDRLMTSISAGFGFSREQASNNHGRGKSYFISRLFKEVIFPESELVGTNQRYERFIRFTRIATFAAVTTLTCSVVLVWAGSVARSNFYISDVKTEINDFKKQEQSLIKGDRSTESVLAGLNSLAMASSVYDRDAHPWLSRLGLYDDSVDLSANQLYRLKLQQYFIPYLLATMEAKLRQDLATDDLYSTFRFYRMFNAVDKLETEPVKNWFSTHWALSFAAEDATRADLERHLEALLAADFPPAELNAQVVEQTRAYLLSMPIAQRIYRRIKADPQYAQKVNLLNLFGNSVQSNFELTASALDKMTIPSLFTIQGYKSLDLSNDSPLFNQVGDDAWVLLDKNANSAMIDTDISRVSQELKALYLADYASTWASVLNALNVAGANNIQDLNRSLVAFVDPAFSPLVAILDVVKNHTQLTPSMIQSAADKVTTGPADKALDYLASKVEPTSVDKRFHDLHQQISQTNRGPAPIQATIQQLEVVRNFLQEIALAPDVDQKAFDVVKARYQSNSGNAITALKAYSRTSPEPVQKWLNAIANESWRVVTQAAYRHINKEWRARVYQPYAHAISGRYPLNPQSKDELAIMDFSGFFKPQGTLDAFVKEYMDPFIDRRGNWSTRSVDGYGLGFSRGFIEQLQRAEKIRDVFFKKNPETPTIDLELKPYFMNKEDVMFTLDLGDQRVTYTHGPKFWKSVTWSGESDSRRIRMVFEDINGRQQDRVFNGPWAWFHLMDAASIEQTAQSNVYRLTFTPELAAQEQQTLRKIVFEGRASSINNPFKNDLLKTFRCPESI